MVTLCILNPIAALRHLFAAESTGRRLRTWLNWDPTQRF
jgi:hypothetical protein